MEPDARSSDCWRKGRSEADEGSLRRNEMEDWKRFHPDTLVLSTETGFVKAYGVDPYGDYYTTEGTLFPIENRDGRLFEKEVIIGIDYNERFKAYPVELDGRMVLNDVFEGRAIVLFRAGNMATVAFESDVNGQHLTFEHKNGQFIDKETGSVWDEHGRAAIGPLEGTVMKRAQGHTAFWFAWADFHPETEVYE